MCARRRADHKRHAALGGKVPPALPAEAPTAALGGKAVPAQAPPTALGGRVVPGKASAAALGGKAVPAVAPAGPVAHERQQPAIALPQGQSINGRAVDQAKAPGEHSHKITCFM